MWVTCKNWKECKKFCIALFHSNHVDVHLYFNLFFITDPKVTRLFDFDFK